MKKSQKKRSSHRTLKKVKTRAIRLFVGIGVLTTITIFAYGVWHLRDVFEPVSSHAGNANNLQDNQVINKDVYSFILVNIAKDNQVERVYVINVDTVERTVRECIIPSNVLLSLPLGLEEYPLRSLFKVSEFATVDSKSSRDLVRHSIHQLLGTTTDYFIVVKDLSLPESAVDWFAKWSTIANVGINNSFTGEHLNTDLSKASLLKISWDLKKAKTYSHRSLTIEEPDYGEIQTQKDGSKYLKVNIARLDAISRKYFEDVQILNEGAQISVINTTKVQGLAGYVGRILENAGAHIVELNSQEETLEKTKILYRDDTWQTSKTKLKIHNTMPIEKDELYEQSDPRSDIKIYLGNDFANFVKGEE